MRDEAELERQVKRANRELYDAVAVHYEAVDGRRSPELEAWLRSTLGALRERAGGGRLLDLGTGSGLICRCAEGLFARRIGIDISPRILAVNRRIFDGAAAADVDRLPFGDRSFDVVTCFAALHHLPAFAALAVEAARVLAPGGVFYSDHDMDRTFYRRFRPLLYIYRRLHDARAAYGRASSRITGEMYDCAECHQRGVPGERIVRLLERAGLRPEARYHWYGLTPLTDRLFGEQNRPRGWAPLFSVVAKKAG